MPKLGRQPGGEPDLRFTDYLHGQEFPPELNCDSVGCSAAAGMAHLAGSIQAGPAVLSDEDCQRLYEALTGFDPEEEQGA